MIFCARGGQRLQVPASLRLGEGACPVQSARPARRAHGGRGSVPRPLLLALGWCINPCRLPPAVALLLAPADVP